MNIYVRLGLQLFAAFIGGAAPVFSLGIKDTLEHLVFAGVQAGVAGLSTVAAFIYKNESFKLT